MTSAKQAMAFVVGALAVACSDGSVAENVTAPDETTGGTTAAVAGGTGASDDTSALYADFGPEVESFIDGSTVILRTADVPPHPSPYFGVGHAMYTTPQAGMVVNPNRIVEQSFEFRVPLNPQVAAAGSDTPLGAIGVAVNGVVLFNQYAGPGFQPLDREIQTFDSWNGHPQQTGQYHYHVDPVDVTGADPTALVGVLLDGFPVYGPAEAGGGTPAGLDECNGHVTATPQVPEGIYHYHVTESFPYISGCFRGTPGFVTN